MAELYAMLGDPTRLSIVISLIDQERCVQDIAEVVNMSPSAVSHQLRLLKALKLVRFRKAGKMAFYTLNDEHVLHLLKIGKEHVEE
jgi:DNA-binding transcriptional ArsR family regulator